MQGVGGHLKGAELQKIQALLRQMVVSMNLRVARV